MRRCRSLLAIPNHLDISVSRVNAFQSFYNFVTKPTLGRHTIVALSLPTRLIALEVPMTSPSDKANPRQAYDCRAFTADSSHCVGGAYDKPQNQTACSYATN
jgi:hypothetical protein